MPRARKKYWSYIAGERGRNRVRAFEHPTTGKLFIEVRENGVRKRIALGHRDREAAKMKVEEVATALRRPDRHFATALTLGTLFDNYLREVTPRKGSHKQQHDRRTAVQLLESLGAGRHPSSITQRDAARFVEERRQRGDQRPGRSFGRELRPRMLDYDVKFLHAVLNWAVNAGWLDRNPLKGYRVEREESPQRPIVTDAEYQALLATSAEISPIFRLALIITHETGHRIGAVRQLRWSDIDFEAMEVRWRGENDKRKYEHTTPLSRRAVIALQEVRRDRAAIGDAWVFPSPTDPAQPVSRHLLRDWWERGTARAGFAPEQRRGWRSLRRKFATELKQIPLKDLCALGGWKDYQTILTCYQRPDQVTMQAALDERQRLQG